jgi:hypothetical protein
MEIARTLAMTIYKPYMDIAIMRKPGNKMNISRWVCVTMHRNTEERREAKVSRAVLEQR